jgi:hypothetical protein
MDNNSIGIIVSIALFIAGTIIDAVLMCISFWLYHKIFKTKLVMVENNQEILEHDKIICKLEERLKALKSGQ